MKIHKMMVRVTVAFLFIFFSFAAIAASTGSIRGTVKDAETGEALPGANVFLQGTSIGAATNIKGEYEISRIPAGTYTLVINYIGYKEKRIEVTVNANQILRQDVALSFVTIQGEAVVVSVQAEGQMEAINQQLSANSIKNVVSSARIQELPDANAAESVGRLPGVSILRSGGEGNKVVIRGMSPQYSAISINGVRMAATGGSDRSTNLSMISPYMLEGIEVTKAATADQDADVIGGTVNFKIKEARKGFRYDLLLQSGYNGLQESYDNYKLVAGVSQRLFKNRLGVFAQLDIEKRNRSSDESGASYRIDNPTLETPNEVLLTSLNLRDIYRNRQRYGGVLVLDYKLPAGKVSLTNFFSRVDNDVVNRGEAFNLQNNSHDYSTSINQNALTVLTNSFQYEQRLSRFRFNASLSHAFSENRTPHNITFTFIENAAFANIDEQVHPSLVPSFAKNDLSNTHLSRIVTNYNYNRETELTAAVNFEVDLRLSRQLSGLLKFGGKYRHKSRAYDHNETFMPIDWGGRQEARDAVLSAFPYMQDTTPLGSLVLPYVHFIDPAYNAGNFLNGEYVLGPSANIDLMRKVNAVTEPLAWWHAQNSLRNDYSGREDYSAGYVMVELNVGRKIRIIPGVRYEHNRTAYTGIRGDGTASRGFDFYVHTDTTTVRKNAFWLPMLHIRFKPLSWFDIRFAYTNTLSRPGYNQIIPAWDIRLNSVAWKNFQLRPSHSTNFDFYFSTYSNKIGLFTIGGFYKQIKDLIFGTGLRAILDPAEYGLPDTELGKGISTQINNKFPVDVWGIETDWQTHFWYLPGPLSGLVFNANYTHIFSEAQYPRTIIKTQYLNKPPWIAQTNIDTSYANRLINQPDDIVNLSIGYDFKGFSARLSMLFQANVFKSNNFYPELRGSTDDYLRWDFSIKQNLPYKGLQLYLNLNNITQSLDRALNAGTNYPVSEQHYGRTIDLGLRFRAR